MWIHHDIIFRPSPPQPVFARLSQPAQPVRCSKVALICAPSVRHRYRVETAYSVLMCRYVLAGPQPCELVDVKVDLMLRYNPVTRNGSYFRAQQSLKLVGGMGWDGMGCTTAVAREGQCFPNYSCTCVLTCVLTYVFARLLGRFRG